MTNKVPFRGIGLLLGLAGMIPGPALAQNPQSTPSDSEIIVTAPRLSGQLDTDTPSELELDEAAIASYGATSISDLLAALSPQTRSGRGRGGGQPIVLINGRRVSGFMEIRNIPPDAIAKVEVFPEEVALQYGYPAEERVVNFVLKPNFRQIAIDPEYGVYTQGGRSRFELDSNYLTISEKSRVNVNGVYETESLLTEAERDLTPISDNGADIAARSLVAAYDKYVGDISIARSLDKVTQLTFAGRIEQTDSLALLGPGIGGVSNPLERSSRNRILSGGTSGNGLVGKWRWAVSANYRDTDQSIFTQRLSGATDRFDSSQQVFGSNATLSGTVARGWAGPIRLTMTGDYDGQRFDSRSLRGAALVDTDLARDAFGAGAALSLSLLDPEYGVAKIGRLAFNGNVGWRDVSDFGGLLSWGAGINWSPAQKLTLNAGFSSDEAAPGIQQLGAAPLNTPQTPYFDAARGETVFIEAVTGGNPLLVAERRRDLRFGLNWQVVQDAGLSVQINRNRSDNTANAFPLLTPAIEAAFPGRATRDANGRLIRLDLRSVNFARTETSQLRWGVNLGGTIGQAPQRGGGVGTGSPTPSSERGGAGRGGAGGGAGRGGAGRGGGFGMMGGPGGGVGRWQLSLFHTVKFDEVILIRPGLAELDLLGGAAVGDNGGSARHSAELDGGFFHKGIGLRFACRYDSGSRVNAGIGGNALAFGDLATLNLRSFFSFDSQPKLIKSAPWLKGLRAAFVIDNVFDAQRRVTDSAGAVPLRYQPEYIDPQGRYVEFSLRKAF